MNVTLFRNGVFADRYIQVKMRLLGWVLTQDIRGNFTHRHTGRMSCEGTETQTWREVAQVIIEAEIHYSQGECGATRAQRVKKRSST